MPYCKKCGSLVVGRFCQNCGTRNLDHMEEIQRQFRREQKEFIPRRDLPLMHISQACWCAAQLKYAQAKYGVPGAQMTCEEDIYAVKMLAKRIRDAVIAAI